jgi:hypothetical protein
MKLDDLKMNFGQALSTIKTKCGENYGMYNLEIDGIHEHTTLFINIHGDIIEVVYTYSSNENNIAIRKLTTNSNILHKENMLPIIEKLISSFNCGLLKSKEDVVRDIIAKYINVNNIEEFEETFAYYTPYSDLIYSYYVFALDSHSKNGIKDFFDVIDVSSNFFSTKTDCINKIKADFEKGNFNVALQAYNRFQEDERFGVDYIFNLSDIVDNKTLVNNCLSFYDVIVAYNNSCVKSNYFYYGENHPTISFVDNDCVKKQILAYIDDIIDCAMAHSDVDGYNAFYNKYLNK